MGIDNAVARVLAALAVFVCVAPPQAASPDASGTTRIVLLGTAGGPPIRLQRVEPSTLVIVGDAPYLIDVGVGSLRNLVAAGFRASDIGTVLITHHHLDHDGGLADLIAYSSFEGRARRVDVIGPNGTMEMVRSSVDYLSVSQRIFGAEILVTPDPTSVYFGKSVDSPGVVFDDGKVKITAVENSHYRFLRTDSASQGIDKSYSYRLDTPGRSIVFTGDTGPSEAVTSLAHGADVLVSEVVDVASVLEFAYRRNPSLKNASAELEQHMKLEHLTPEEVGKMASRAAVKMVILTHFSPGADGETDMRKYTDGVRALYKGPVIVGRDLEEF